MDNFRALLGVQRLNKEAAERDAGVAGGVDCITDASALLFSQSLAPSLRGRVWVALEVDGGDQYSHFSTGHDAAKYSAAEALIASVVHAVFRRVGLTNEAYSAATARWFPRRGLPAPVFANEVRDERPRLGAFEVYFVINDGTDRLRTVLLHSKLNSSLWPNPRNVVRNLLRALGTVATAPEASTSTPTPRRPPRPAPEFSAPDPPRTPASPQTRAFRRRAASRSSPAKASPASSAPRSSSRCLVAGRKDGRRPCEACGAARYGRLHVIWQRFNKVEGGTHTACRAHGWPDEALRKARDSRHALTRWSARRIGDCCALRCATNFCNHLYVREANHARSCFVSSVARARPEDYEASEAPDPGPPGMAWNPTFAPTAPAHYLTSEYAIRGRDTASMSAHAPVKRVRVAVVVRFPTPHSPHSASSADGGSQRSLLLDAACGSGGGDARTADPADDRSVSSAPCAGDRASASSFGGGGAPAGRASRPSWGEPPPRPSPRRTPVASRAKVVIAVTPLGEAGTGERERGHYEDGLITGLDAAWAKAGPGNPVPSWLKSNGVGYAEPMRVDVAGPRSPYGNLATTGGGARSARKIARTRARGIRPPVLGYPKNSSKFSFRRQIEPVSHDSWTIRSRSPRSPTIGETAKKLAPEHSS